MAGLGPVTKGSALTSVFISGPVAITVRDWNSAARPPTVAPGPDYAAANRPQASITAAGRWFSRSCRSATAGCGKQTCFMVLPDPGMPRFGYQPQSCNNDADSASSKTS